MTLTSSHYHRKVAARDTVNKNKFYFAVLARPQVVRADVRARVLRTKRGLAVSSRIWWDREDKGVIAGVRTPAMEYVVFDPKKKGNKRSIMRWDDFPQYEFFTPKTPGTTPCMKLPHGDRDFFGANKEVKPFRLPEPEPPLKMMFAHEHVDTDDSDAPTNAFHEVEYTIQIK